MHFLPVLALSAAAVFHAGSSVSRSDPVLVHTVLDGDTINIQGVGRVRLLGIAAPKRHGADLAPPFARQARDRLADLVLRHWVRLEGEPQPGSATAWRSAYVWREDGVFVNAVLVREGLARAAVRRIGARQDELQRAEDEARSFGRGLWSHPSGTNPAGQGHRRVSARMPFDCFAEGKQPHEWHSALAGGYRSHALQQIQPDGVHHGWLISSPSMCEENVIVVSVEWPNYKENHDCIVFSPRAPGRGGGAGSPDRT